MPDDAAKNTQPGGGHSSFKNTTWSGVRDVSHTLRTHVGES